MAISIESRLYDIQLRLYRVELKLDQFFTNQDNQNQTNIKLAALTKTLNAVSDQLEGAVDEAYKTLPPMPPVPPT